MNNWAMLSGDDISESGEIKGVAAVAAVSASSCEPAIDLENFHFDVMAKRKRTNLFVTFEREKITAYAFHTRVKSTAADLRGGPREDKLTIVKQGRQPAAIHESLLHYVEINLSPAGDALDLVHGRELRVNDLLCLGSKT